MTEAENAEVFSSNLRRYAKMFGKTGKEIAEAIGVTPASVSYWMTGKKYPSIDNVELLARYFGIHKSDLIEERARTRADPQTVEARIVSGAMDQLPQEQREKILNLFKAMYANNPELFRRRDDDDET